MSDATVGKISRIQSTKNRAMNTIRNMTSALLARVQLAARAGLQAGGDRDFYNTFGWKVKVTSDDFLAKYIRQDIVSRVISAPPGATWSRPPELLGPTNIAEAWDKVTDGLEDDLWNVMQRADKLSRMNNFSIIMLGYDDTGDVERPVDPSKVKRLLYARPVGSRLVTELKLSKDKLSPRYGLPILYTIKFNDPSKQSIINTEMSTDVLSDIKVHHSRIIHIVEDPLEDTINGIPIMEKIYNLMDDLLKTVGGTAETFWLAGNRGFQADIDPELELNADDETALSDELDDYSNQLRRIMRTRGVDIKVLDNNIPSPKELFDMEMALLSGTTGIPRRIILGSEAGQLASEQDRANWADRIAERRALFAEPSILRPLVKNLQSVNLLPEGRVTYKWPSAFILSPLEEGQTQAQTARAVGNLSRQTGNKTTMQITSTEEARNIVGLEGDLPESDKLMQDVEVEQIPKVAPGDDPNGRGSEEEEEEET